jgi:hypothetical protein
MYGVTLHLGRGGNIAAAGVSRCPGWLSALGPRSKALSAFVRECVSVIDRISEIDSNQSLFLRACAHPKAQCPKPKARQ